MLDYDGGGSLDTDEFCEGEIGRLALVRMVISHPTLPGVLRASTSEKPLELTRLVKQCSDILKLCDWDWHGMVLRTGTLSSAPNMSK